RRHVPLGGPAAAGFRGFCRRPRTFARAPGVGGPLRAARRGPGAGPVHAGARSAGRLARGELSGHARSPEYKMISVDAASLRLTWLLFQPRRVYEASRWAEENLGTGLGDSGRPAGQRMEPGENSP